ETMITTGDEKHLARAKLRASSLACSPFFSAPQRAAACRAPTKRSRPSPENTWKRQGWVNLWLGAQWAASSNSSIHSRGISVGRYSFSARRVLIAVSASSRGRSVVFAMILPPDPVSIISTSIYRKFKPRATSPDGGLSIPFLFDEITSVLRQRWSLRLTVSTFREFSKRGSSPTSPGLEFNGLNEAKRLRLQTRYLLWLEAVGCVIGRR